MKKLTTLLMVAVMAIPFFLTSCQLLKKKPTTASEIARQDSIRDQEDFLKLVHSTTNKKLSYVSAKLKFSVEIGAQHLRLTGNLRMKRDDVIRLQLMAFGFVEAARIEFTKDEVLVVDRINKQFLRAPYRYVDFLRNSDIDFYTMQSLFWDELFIPGKANLKVDALKNFSTSMGGDEAIIYLDHGKINYSWLANEKTGRIKMTNIMYRDPVHGNSQLNWDYNEYSILNGQLFPSDMVVTLTTPLQEMKVGVKLNYLGTDNNWEPRTKVSDKYREVPIEEILRRLMAI